MTRQTRRGALAAGASTLAALAGCSSLPFTSSGENSLPSYDELSLADAIRDSTVEVPETYPGPIPASLLETHRERTQALLASVPEEPSFPNEAVSDQLREHRERAVERRPESTTDDPTLEAVADWRRARGDAAEVVFAYQAAAGELDRTEVEVRRVRVRDDYHAAHSEVAYAGENSVDALAVGFELESEFADTRRDLSPEGSYPENPRSEPFHAGEVAASVENARAHLDTATALRDAYLAPGMTDHWTDVAVAAGRLAEARHATTERVAPFLFDDPEPRDVLEGDARNTTAVDLLRSSLFGATKAAQSATSARERGDYASAVVYTARSLIDTLATGRTIDAIRNDDYSVPADAAAVEAERDAAIDAIQAATSATPDLLAALTVAPTVRGFQYADDRLLEDPNDRTVARESARYTHVSYAARAVPNVVDRVAQELGVESE